MLRFKNADLRPVLSEALAQRCDIYLVKDQGVYFMSAHGERLPSGTRKHLAYAVGCNPATDAFEDWYDLAHREMGGDDFGESFDPQRRIFTYIMTSADDLTVSATGETLILRIVAP